MVQLYGLGLDFIFVKKNANFDSNDVPFFTFVYIISGAKSVSFEPSFSTFVTSRYLLNIFAAFFERLVGPLLSRSSSLN